MRSNEFERMFSEFLDAEAYDKVETDLFELVRSAYHAGWEAAEEYAGMAPQEGIEGNL